jgi:hypothetical protein
MRTLLSIREILRVSDSFLELLDQSEFLIFHVVSLVSNLSRVSQRVNDRLLLRS